MVSVSHWPDPVRNMYGQARPEGCRFNPVARRSHYLLIHMSTFFILFILLIVAIVFTIVLDTYKYCRVQ